MKKAASIFFKSRKLITAWFDNECVATPVVLPKNILQCTRSPLTVQCWWKSKKININILIAKGGLEPLQPPPRLRLWSYIAFNCQVVGKKHCYVLRHKSQQTMIITALQLNLEKHTNICCCSSNTLSIKRKNCVARKVWPNDKFWPTNKFWIFLT